MAEKYFEMESNITIYTYADKINTKIEDIKTLNDL